MNRFLFAKALAAGLEHASCLDFQQAKSLIDQVEVTSGDVVGAERGDVVHWSYSPIQLLDFDGVAAVEMSVQVTDGEFFESVMVYIREEPRFLNCSLPTQAFLDEVGPF